MLKICRYFIINYLEENSSMKPLKVRDFIASKPRNLGSTCVYLVMHYTDFSNRPM